MTIEIGYCPYPKCQRRLFTLDVDGEVLTVSPVARGELRWTTQSMMLEEWDTFDAFCHRHGHVAEFGVDSLKHNYHCATVEVVTTRPAAT